MINLFVSFFIKYCKKTIVKMYKIFLIIYYLIVTLMLTKINGEEIETKCTKEYCNKYIKENKCPEISEECQVMNATHNGVWLRYPDVCNCCNYCLTNIKAGGNCVQGLFDLNQPTEICGAGLECTMNDNLTATCQKIKTPCTEAQDDWDKRRADGTLGMLEIRPKCDEDGLYSSFHCIPGSICYCVAPNGQRIFGEIVFFDSWDQQKMSCGCSLNDWKARAVLNPDSVENNINPSLSARCNAYGEFDSLQCFSGSLGNCTCVDPITGHPTDSSNLVSLPNIKQGNPKCFNSAIHKTGVYKTECETMKISYFNNETTLYEKPSCQPDGMFDRVQQIGTRLICVDPSGQEIIYNGISYFTDVDSDESKIINCNCAKTLWLLSSAGVNELPQCNSFGNFKSWQCRRNECYCVDTNGNQCGSEKISINYVDKLTCYTKESTECLTNN